mgnify:CR=1 FL=1
MLPAQLRDSLASRAGTGDELKTYAQRLAWVKLQMEHSRGIQQAAGYAPHGKDASGDVNMYSVDGPPGIEPDAIASMTWAMAESAQAGDWELTETLQHAIYAMKGSKGMRKGLGKGKGPGKGSAAPAAAAKGGSADTFQGICNHSHIWGHRKTECRKLDKELAAKGGSKGKAGGKGGPTDGKGPPSAAATLAEVGADDHWAGDLLDGALAGAAAELDEWALGGAIYSLTAAPPAAAPLAEAAAEAVALEPAGLSSVVAPRRLAQPISSTTSSTTAAAASASSRLAKTYCGTFPKTASGTAAAASASRRLADDTTLLERPTRTFAVRVEAAKRRYGVETKTQNSFDALSLLTDDAEELLAAVSGDASGGQVVEAVVDSGAVHSVTPPGWFPGPTVPSAWSRAGRGYRAANGTAIKNLGQVTVKFAEVEQPLPSVAHLTSAGNRVELGHDSGRVVNLTTGRAIALERRGGVYIMRMYIVNGVVPAPFRRQGA